MGKVKGKTLQNSLAYRLWQANNHVQRELRRVLLEFGLTYVEYLILVALVVDMNKVTWQQQQVVKHLKIDKNMTSQALKSLENKQLLFRIKDELNGRQITVRASARAVNLLRLASQAVNLAESRLFKQN